MMATYYVATNGNNSNPGTSSQPFASLQYACAYEHLGPGDVIRVKSGTYTNTYTIINPKQGSKQGTSGNPITITADDPSNPPVFTNPDDYFHAMIQINHRSWWTIENLHFLGFRNAGVRIEIVADDPWAYGAVQSMEGITVRNCRFDQNGKGMDVVYQGAGLPHMLVCHGEEPYTVSYVYFLNNHIEWALTGEGETSYAYNECLTAHHNCHHVLFQGNTVVSSSFLTFDVIAKNNNGPGKPHHVIFTDNVVHNVRPDVGGNNNAFKSDGGDYILFQNNYVYNAEGFVLGVEPWSDTYTSEYYYHIARNNVHDATGKGNGIWGLQLGANRWGGSPASSTRIDKLYAVHNTTIIDGSERLIIWCPSKNVRLKNNVLWRKKKSNIDPGHSYMALENTSAESTYMQGEGYQIGGNLWYTSEGDPKWQWPTGTWYNDFNSWKTSREPTAVYGAPVFKSGSYELASTSPGYEAGTWLTTATETKSTASTTLKVADAGYFCDGWGLIDPDVITINGENATVVSVNYDTNTLTISPGLTWTAGDGVGYALNHGSVPTPGYNPTMAGATPIDPDPPPPPPPPPERDPGLDLNQNPTFESGTSSWEFYSGSVADPGNYVLSVAGGIATISGNDAGNWTQLMQRGVSLVEGEIVKVTLRAKSSKPVTVTTDFIQDTSPYAAYGGWAQHSLSSTWQDITYTFSSSTTDTSARARLNIMDSPDGTSVTIEVDTFLVEVAGEEVTYDPPVADPAHPADLTVEESQDATLTAVFTGSGIQSFEWRKADGTQLTDSAKYSGTGTSALTIVGVVEEDEGGYYCVATNQGGSTASRTATLTVNAAVGTEGGLSMQLSVAVSGNDAHATSVNTTWAPTDSRVQVGHKSVSSGGSQNLQVNASGNDTMRNTSGYWGITDTYLSLGHFSSPYAYDSKIGARFVLTTGIPGGSTVGTTTFQMYMSRDTANVALRIYAEKYANPSAWSSQTDFNGRTLTTAYVSWSPSFGSQGWYTSPDISSVIQELVDAFGGVGAGSVIAIRVQPASSSWPGSTQGYYVWSYDNSTTLAPKLNLTWDSGSDDYNLIGGARFQLTSAIPSTAKVTQCYLRVNGKRVGTTVPMTIKWETGSTTTQWTSRTDFLGRTYGATTYAWTPALTTSDAWYNSPDMSDYLQAKVDSFGGMAAGSYVTIYLHPTSLGWPGSQNYNSFRSYDYGSSSAPQLIIYWQNTDASMDADFDASMTRLHLTAKGISTADMDTAGVIKPIVRGSFDADFDATTRVQYVVSLAVEAQFNAFFGQTVDAVPASASMSVEGSLVLTMGGDVDVTMSALVGSISEFGKTVSATFEADGLISGLTINSVATARFSTNTLYLSLVGRVMLDLNTRYIEMDLRKRR